MTAIPNRLFKSQGDNLKQWFGTDNFGYAYIFGAVYALSSGVSHSNQYGLAGLLKAVNAGEYNFVENVREYGHRARAMKQLFTDNGFHIVYDRDEEREIADGFYFTIAYQGFTGEELVEELLYYGISAISLITTGSDRHEGLRACVSLTGKERFPDLDSRLRQFAADHPKGSDFKIINR